MVLLIEMIVICLACIVMAQYFSRPLERPNLLSGSMTWYPKAPVIIFWIVLIFVSGFRYSFCDTAVYRNLCEDIGTEWSNATSDTFVVQDVGFNLLMIAINKLGLHSQYLILVTAFATFLIYAVYIYRYSIDVPYSLLLFMMVSYFTMINGVRQVLAGAIIFLALPFVRDKKFIPYALAVLLASTFHASAMVMLPLSGR